MTKKNKKLAIAFAAGCVLIVAVCCFAGIYLTGGFQSKNVICKGITVDGVKVGGLTKKEASEKIEEHISSVKNRQVTIHIGDETVTTTAEKMGFSGKTGDAVDKAFQVGKEGGIFAKIKAVNNAKADKTNFEISYEVNEAMLGDYVEIYCSRYDVKMKNSKLKLVDGQFVATKSRDGHEVQVEETAEKISKALLEDVSKEPLEVEAIVESTPAKYTKEQVSKCKDVLGSYTTYYGTSTQARATNVRVAANYINGTVIYPGKTFSVIATIKDRTIENGYMSAAEYSSGKVVDGIGGGVCQVSTTLYNAVINAELEIVERAPHSMVVGYVDVSRDAAIAGDYKDFKFKNNTEVPIYISASADGANLTFKIYGQETRAANRTLKFQSEIIQEIEPGKPVETVDKTKPASYRAVTQSAHVGYVAKLWKIVYIDGVESEKIQINSSTYAAEPEYVTVGKKPEESKQPEETKKPEKTAKPEETKKPSVTKKPNSTKKPSKTSKPTASPKATKKE